MAFGLTPAGSGFPPQAPDLVSELHPVPEQRHELGRTERRHRGLRRRSRTRAARVRMPTRWRSTQGPTLRGRAAGRRARCCPQRSNERHVQRCEFQRLDRYGAALQHRCLVERNVNQIDLQQTGLYEVTIEGRVTPQTNVWPAAQGGFTYYGSEANPSVGGVVGQHEPKPSRADGSSGGGLAGQRPVCAVPRQVRCERAFACRRDHADALRERLHGRG